MRILITNGHRTGLGLRRTPVRALLLTILGLVLVGLQPMPSLAAHIGYTMVDIKDTVKRVYDAAPGGTLEVDADVGNIEIRSGKDNKVRVVVERVVTVSTRDEAKSVLETHKLDIDRKGNTIWVHSRIESDRFAWRRTRNKLRVRVIVEVPDEYNLEIASGAGNIDVHDIEGLATIRTGAGNVVASNTEGRLDIVSGSGNITVDDAINVRIRNGSGNLNLSELSGSLEAETGAGNITAWIVGSLDGRSRLSTSAGNVTVHISDDVGASVHAVARVGNCSTDFPLQVTGGWMKKSFDGAVNGGGPELSLSSNVGNVTLVRNND